MAEISKTDFWTAKILNGDCKYVLKWSHNFYKKKTENNQFLRKNDTVLSDLSLKQYALYDASYKRGKKPNSSHYNYVIKDSTEFYLPFFEDPIGYELWLKEPLIISGVFQEYGKYIKNKGYNFYYKLKNISKSTKVLVIPSDCEVLD